MINMAEIIKWSNENAGFLSIILFVVALFLGWISGIFQSLRKRPKFEIRIIPGQQFAQPFAQEIGSELSKIAEFRFGKSQVQW
jgi:hypothetical protein